MKFKKGDLYCSKYFGGNIKNPNVVLEILNESFNYEIQVKVVSVSTAQKRYKIGQVCGWCVIDLILLETKNGHPLTKMFV